MAGASAEVTDEESRLPELPCSIQQRNCEAETLRVFRLITGQVIRFFHLGHLSITIVRIEFSPLVEIDASKGHY